MIFVVVVVVANVWFRKSSFVERKKACFHD
jgi:hypothetical protein